MLVQPPHLPLPSLIVTSSQVRVGMPLPLQECSIPGLGPKGLWHDRTIPVNLPGIFLLRVTLASGETLPTRTFHGKLQGQSAVSRIPPTMSQHPLEKQVMSSRTFKDQNFSWFTSDVFLQDSSKTCTSSYVLFFSRKPHARVVPSMDSSTHLKP
jgi:hypothetical protein